MATDTGLDYIVEMIRELIFAIRNIRNLCQSLKSVNTTK